MEKYSHQANQNQKIERKNTMVVNDETKVALHQLTEIGKQRYRKYLEDEGTRILREANLRKNHFFKWIWCKIFKIEI